VRCKLQASVAKSQLLFQLQAMSPSEAAAIRTSGAPQYWTQGAARRHGCMQTTQA
jgi:hypothetical protein